MIPMKWEDFCDLGAKQYIQELEQKLQQKENIIKEVREYVDKQDNMNYKFREDLREITRKGE